MRYNSGLILFSFGLNHDNSLYQFYNELH